MGVSHRGNVSHGKIDVEILASVIFNNYCPFYIYTIHIGSVVMLAVKSFELDINYVYIHYYKLCGFSKGNYSSKSSNNNTGILLNIHSICRYNY